MSANSQVLTFQPSQPWAHDALIQVFLEGGTTDLAGNSLETHQATFQVVPDPTGVRPVVKAFATAGIVGGVPINGAIDVLFSKPLDPASVNAMMVILCENAAGRSSQLPWSLLQQGFVIRVQPQAEPCVKPPAQPATHQRPRAI